MYTVVSKPDKKILSTTGLNLKPIITLEDKFDGRLQICLDDGGYVLYTANRVGTYNKAYHWFPEVIKALITYIKEDHP